MKKIAYYCNYCRKIINEKEVYILSGECIDVSDYEEPVTDMSVTAEDLTNEVLTDCHLHHYCYLDLVKKIKRYLEE